MIFTAIVGIVLTLLATVTGQIICPTCGPVHSPLAIFDESRFGYGLYVPATPIVFAVQDSTVPPINEPVTQYGWASTYPTISTTGLSQTGIHVICPGKFIDYNNAPLFDGFDGPELKASWYIDEGYDPKHFLRQNVGILNGNWPLAIHVPAALQVPGDVLSRLLKQVSYGFCVMSVDRIPGDVSLFNSSFFNDPAGSISTYCSIDSN